MKLEPFGECALRIAFDAGTDVRALDRALRSMQDVRDVVVATGLACVHFDPLSPPRIDLALLEAALGREARALPPPASHSIRVRYDGADLAHIAATTGLSPARLVALHTAREYTVAMIGFLPGFAYLAGLDPALRVPRLAQPRTRVPAGSVALAEDRTAVYPFATPGGWNLLGTAVDFDAFDRTHGATLALGDRVRFVAVAP